MPYPSRDFPAELRSYDCDGSHDLTHTRELVDSSGSVEIEFCADPVCARVVRTLCLHTQNSWHWGEGDRNDEETPSALLCDLCGKDGT